MVQSGATVKARIEGKIFKKPPGTDVTITPITRSQGGLSGYEGNTDAEGTSVVVIGVPFNVLRNSRDYQSFGTDAEGQTKVAVKADTSVSRNDKIEIAATGKSYEVVDIEDYPYNDLNLAIILTAKEII